MSFTKKVSLLSLIVLLMQQGAYGALPTVPTPTPGQWCSDSTAAKAYAEANGIPVIAIWGSTSCGYCNSYDTALSDPAFIAWRQGSPYIYIYIKNTQDAFYSWMWGTVAGATRKLDAYPFVMYYWKKNGVVLVEQRWVGRESSGNYPMGGPLAGRTRALAEQYFAAYSSVPLPTDAWDTNDNTRAGTTNIVAFGETATVQGPHSLNMTDTNDWLKITGSVLGISNRVWFTDITTNAVLTGLKAEFFVGESLTPAGTLANLQGDFVYQATSTEPLYVKISRSANTNALVSYKVNYKRDVAHFGKIGYSRVQYGILPAATYSALEETVYEGQTITVWLSRVDGSDSEVAAMLNWNTNWPSKGPFQWGHGAAGEKSLTFTVPEEAGYQAAGKSLKLTIASNAPAATVVGKTILSLKIYDKDYASVSFTNLVTSGEPVLGQWYGYKSPVSGPAGAFADYTNLAARLNIPLIIYWGNEGCPLCNGFVSTNNTPLVQGWIANQKVLFLALKGLLSEDGNTGYNWIRSRLADPNSSYPWLGFYWKKTSGELVTHAQSFSKKIGDEYIHKTGQEFIDAMNVWLAGYDNNGVLYTTMGGQFACGNIPTARLEAEPTTTDVEIPFVRTRGFQTPGTNHLVVTYPGATPAPGPTGFVASSIPVSTVQTNMFLWAPGDTNKTFVVAGVNTHYAVDQKVQLLLLDNELKPVDTNAITYVAAVPNGALNPFFDKTPAVGEWTMDLAKATNATAQTIGEAYTLVMFSGGYWCPWCIGMEETVFAKPEFKTFAQNNNIRLVMLDNPRRDATPPTLLRHDVDWMRTKFSGSSYLSRNGITVAQGAAKLIANSNQQYNAGWLFPSTTRIGYPTVLLLRKDGTVAGRVGMTNNGTTVTNVVTGVKSYPYDTAPAILRLTEALTLVSDGNEENNGHRDWTAETLAKDGVENAQLSASDKNDVYRLTGVGSGMRQVIQISGPQAATVTLSIQNAAGATLAGPVSGNLLTGFALTNAVPTTNTFVVVNASGTEFAGTSTSSTIRDYTLTSSIILIATESARSLMVTAADQIPVDIQLGMVYRFAGTYQCDTNDFEDLGNNLWRAKKTGLSTLTFTGVVGEASFTWQLWIPGVIGFTVTTTNITETVGTFTFRVERTNGSSGAVDALVSLGAGTTAEAYRHAFPAGGVNLHWADGQVGSTSVTFSVVNDIVFDGTQILQLALSIVGLEPKAGLAVSKELMNISIIENDAPVVGQLQFVPAAGQYFAKTMTIVAVEGSTIPLAIERVNGANTDISAAITTTAGTLSGNTLTWLNKNPNVLKQVDLTVPAMTVAKTITVTFVPTGTTAVYGKNKLTIQVVAAKPAIEAATAAFNLTTRVAVLETIGVETIGAGRVTFSKLSGSLPYGVSVSYDSAEQKMVLKGTPTSVGQYSAVYQVNELVGFTTVHGGTIRLSLVVRDLATINPAATAQSYSFANYTVVDPATNKVTGLFNLTIGTTGRISAKYTYAAGSTSFSATSWSSIEPDGTLTAVMTATGYVLTVEMDAAGHINALLTETATDKDMLINLVLAPWSVSTPATQYQGYYTVALSANTEEDGAVAIGNPAYMPKGHSYMTLSMSTYGTSSGTMSYAGKLANGVSFSGSAVLLPYSGAQPSGVVHDYATLGFFKKTGKEIISGQLAIQANAKNTYKDYPRVVYGGDKAEIADVWWTHTELVPELSYQWKYGVYGGYYSSADDLAAFYEEYGTTYGDAPMVISFGSALLPASTQYGALTLYPNAYSLNITASTISLTTPVADGTGTTYSFTKATGIFSGTFRMNFASRAGVYGKYAGVLLPAWTDCGCGGEPIKEMPFGMGASWFTDQAFISGGTRYPVRGCPVEIFPRDL